MQSTTYSTTTAQTTTTTHEQQQTMPRKPGGGHRHWPTCSSTTSTTPLDWGHDTLTWRAYHTSQHQGSTGYTVTSPHGWQCSLGHQLRYRYLWQPSSTRRSATMLQSASRSTARSSCRRTSGRSHYGLPGTRSSCRRCTTSWRRRTSRTWTLFKGGIHTRHS